MDEAFVIENPDIEGDERFFRPGHKGHSYYPAVHGWWPLWKAKIYSAGKAREKCIELRGGEAPRCFVRRIRLVLGAGYYPPSKKREIIGEMLMG